MGYIPPDPPRMPRSDRPFIRQSDNIGAAIRSRPTGFTEAMLGASILAGLVVSVAYVVMSEIAAFTTGGAF